LNIEAEISESLWIAIESSYSSQNYSSAILDAVVYLSNIVRERTGLESDGVALAGSAFGGKNPKLKVNKLQTESDRNVQKGIEQIFRGIFQGIRNPRSHEKYNDNKDDADAIILFINYLLKIISESKSPFTKSEFLNKVFDPYFPDNAKYSELLVSEIPVKYRLEILINTFREKYRGASKKHRIFFQALLEKLKPDEISQLSDVISEELEQVNEESTIRETIQILPTDFWKNIKESVRIRTENILIESIKSGKYDSIKETCHSGALGTLAESLLKDFITKDDILYILLDKLGSDNKLESDYVFKYFFISLFRLLKDSEEYFQDFASEIIISGLKEGDLRFYKSVKIIKHSLNTKIIDKIQEYIDNFKAKQEAIELDDDLPF